MKTDKQMAQNILCRVNEIREERRTIKNSLLTLTAVTCAFALMLTSVFSLYFGRSPLSDSTTSAAAEGAQRKSAFLLVAGAAYETETLINKEADVILPLGGILTAKDTKGMTNEEKDTVMLGLKDRLLELYGKECSWTLKGVQEDTTVYFGTADYLKVKAEDSGSIDSITISCTENGKLTVSDKSKLGSALPSEYIRTVKQGASITVTGKEYAEIYGKADGIRIEWFLSDEMISALKESPDTPLSTVNDEITVIINYTDGSTEKYTVSLSFDDDGILSAKCSF